MTHNELVQVATDMLFAVPDSEKWLSRYDLALASETDHELTDLVAALRREFARGRHRMAA